MCGRPCWCLNVATALNSASWTVPINELQANVLGAACRRRAFGRSSPNLVVPHSALASCGPITDRYSMALKSAESPLVGRKYDGSYSLRPASANSIFLLHITQRTCVRRADALTQSGACQGGFKGAHGGLGLQASHQQRVSHETVHILFLANDRCLRDYDLVVAHC